MIINPLHRSTEPSRRSRASVEIHLEGGLDGYQGLVLDGEILYLCRAGR